jgi:acyl carrier protein
VDSTGVFEVIAFLNQAFGIEVGDREVVPENLDTIGRIANFVERKKT